MPAHRRAFAPEWQKSAEETDAVAASNLERSQGNYNQHVRELPELRIGSHVVIQNPRTKLWDIYGIVVEVGPYRRYHVRTQGGRVFVRNRRFLRRRFPLTSVCIEPTRDAAPSPVRPPAQPPSAQPSSAQPSTAPPAPMVPPEESFHEHAGARSTS